MKFKCQINLCRISGMVLRVQQRSLAKCCVFPLSRPNLAMRMTASFNKKRKKKKRKKKRKKEKERKK